MAKGVHQEELLLGKSHDERALLQIELDGTKAAVAAFVGRSWAEGGPPAHERAKRAALCVNLFRGIDDPGLVRKYSIACEQLLSAFITVARDGQQEPLLFPPKVLSDQDRLRKYAALTAAARELMGGVGSWQQQPPPAPR